MDYSTDNQMTCYQAQLLMWPYVENDPHVGAEERLLVEAHLRSCCECAREYEDSKFVIALVKKYCNSASDQPLPLPEKEEPPECRMTVAEGWEDLKRRIPELARLQSRRRHLWWFRRVAAVAACLAICVFARMAFLIHSKLQFTRESTPRQVAAITEPTVKVCLLSNGRRIVLPAGTEVRTAQNQTKTLVINNRHRMVMNENSALSIEPLVQGTLTGCVAELASGEIFTRVEHDGNPFIVSTSHGVVVITGTGFDVKATAGSTTVVVAEGSVKFGSEAGTVKVAAGQMSRIAGHSAPTEPAFCNAAELTAWARGPQTKTALAEARSYSDSYNLSELWVKAISGPVNLESIDGEDWVEKNRDWFKREFPWIFQLQDVLVKQGIKVDYPELLVSSGDIWQFVYPQVSPSRISVVRSGSLLKTASQYGFNKQWLLENAPALRFAVANRVKPEDKFFGLEAWEKWSDRIKQARSASEELNTETLLYSLHAGCYIANTRTLVWLCIRNNTLAVNRKDKAKLLSLLEDQVNTANRLLQITLQAMTVSERTCVVEMATLSEQIGCLVRLYDIEKGLSQYIKRN
jgi:ferric-dicitrate binding protein FerR (iron transport regulator)